MLSKAKFKVKRGSVDRRSDRTTSALPETELFGEPHDFDQETGPEAQDVRTGHDTGVAEQKVTPVAGEQVSGNEELGAEKAKEGDDMGSQGDSDGEGSVSWIE